MKEHKHEPEDITEQPVKLKVKTAWAVLMTIVGTTVWITALLMRIHGENKEEHGKLMLGLTDLQMRSSYWVTREQFEDVLVYLLHESHRGMTNFASREWLIRQEVHRRLNSPKDKP